MSEYFDHMLFEEVNPEEQEKIIQEAVEKLTNKNLSFRQLTDMHGLRELAQSSVSEAVAARRQTVSLSVTSNMTDEVVGQVGGLGFLLPLFQRDDINEIILLSTDGSLWILPKGEENFVKHINQVDRKEVSKALDALLRPSGKSVTEAQPSVNAKLERIESLPGLAGGARIKVLHSVIASGKGKYPEFNIRLFEPRPVKPEQLIKWQVAPEAVIQKLLVYVNQGARILVSGGTKSGKTTTLSALCSAVPTAARK